MNTGQSLFIFLKYKHFSHKPATHLTHLIYVAVRVCLGKIKAENIFELFLNIVGSSQIGFFQNVPFSKHAKTN